ncbi:arsenic resistance protein [Aspergillus melleus]|uniref:arsenic resistance protein n=1 Tax=Aspergillus melleus TaxID=138277 RepID=UPI001E8EDD30|nr:arsenicals resistance [Aspergillus melleus]KAH8422732.1 arsenicals resistance [Aspergillus melleus]
MSQEKDSSTDPETGCISTECQCDTPDAEDTGPTSAFQQLAILDRFLALWIFLVMAVGIILGNFVPNTSKALEKGKFVGVSVPIVWTGLAGGDGEYCAILVAVNSILQMVLFAPMAIFFIRVIGGSDDGLTIDYSLAAKSVGVFLGIPLGAAIVTRFALRLLIGKEWYDRHFLKRIGPLSLIGLLFTILVLFASQGRQVVHQIVSVIRVAAPLIVYFAVIFLVTLAVTRRCGFGYKLSCTQSFTAASNNFELAIAVAIATFGVDSDQALAATVGPLIEVPVLLGLVYVVKWLARRQRWT